MNNRKISYPLQDRWSYVWLLIATVLTIFSQSSGKWVIPIAAWLGPIFYIRFFRTQRRVWLAFLLAAISIGIAAAVVLPTFTGPMGLPLIIATALFSALPLLADRWLAPRLPGFASTLAFPLAMTALEFIGSVTSPFGSSGLAVYTQYNNLALLQLVSLTGMWGLLFLMRWLGSIANWAWERDFAWPEIKRGVLFYAGLILLVLVYGQARLWFAPTPAQTVRVAGVSLVEWRLNQPAMSQAFATDLDAFRQMMEERYQLYFDATLKEARAGAKMISWPENAATVAEEDEPALLTRLQELAKQESVYLAIPMVVMPTDDSPYANKLLIFDPHGQVVVEHYKYGGSGMEGNRISGDRVLHTAQTPFGVISGVICWDTLLQGVVLQAGRNGTDILFTPSLVYPELDPVFAQYSVTRAIENGVSVIHVSDMGLSVMTDPYGRILAATDHYPQGERVIVAQIPTQGAWTLYPFIGDLFGWLAVVGFVVLVIWGVIQSLRARKVKAAGPESQAPVGQAI
jgi:apolipoprotein N-acyltransferase